MNPQLVVRPTAESSFGLYLRFPSQRESSRDIEVFVAPTYGECLNGARAIEGYQKALELDPAHPVVTERI